MRKIFENYSLLLLFTFVSLAVLFVALYSRQTTNFFVETSEYNIKMRLLETSKRLAELTSAEELNEFQTAADMNSVAYRDIKHRLADFAEETGLVFAYYVREAEDGMFQYIVDNDFNPETVVGLDTPPHHSPPGYGLPEAFSGQSIYTELGEYLPDWHGYMSAYSPIFDEQGRVAAIAGADIYDQEILDARARVNRLLILELVAVLAVFACGIVGFSIYKRKAKVATEASNAKSTFLTNMSHEIRKPMNAIIGISQIQLQKGDLTPQEYKEALENIHNAGGTLLGIINDILDLSKIETGKMELVPIEYDVPSLVNDTIQLNMTRLGSKPLEFLLEIDENFPARMIGDELRLRQIMNNLLSNAIKYTKKGHVKLSFSHVEDHEYVWLNISVEDTGQGLKPEDKGRLFSGYTRFGGDASGDSGTGAEGTGIGLTITKNLVEMMDGSIKVESEYGKGSTFSVAVRQKAVECETIGKEIADRLRNFAVSGGKRLNELQISRSPMPYGKVLVVDDVEHNLYIAEGLLSHYELKIDTASSGYAAIDKVKKNDDYDLIFMDHMMPFMDGVEATRKLRELGCKCAIVALTANTIVGNDELFRLNGFDGYIAKPIDLRQLNAVLNKFVRARHPEEAAKYKPQLTTDTAGPLITPKLLAVFCRDAENAAITLTETLVDGNLKRYTTCVHSMKSALANIGEHDISALAASLEMAGIDENLDFIKANTESFIETLESIVERLRPKEPATEQSADSDEDIEHLTEQLRVVELSCDNLDDEAALFALDTLKRKQWSAQVLAALDAIYDALYNDSDFEEAARLAVELSESVNC